MIKSFRGKMPKVAPSAYVSEMACLIGDVEIGENSCVWPGAVIRGDFGPISIGNNVYIDDNCVIHGEVTIGDNVVIGHSAVVEARRVGNRVLIGNHATILFNSEIGDSCLIAAGALVPEGMKIPPHSFVAGMPAQVKELSAGQLSRMEFYLSFSREMKEAYSKEEGEGFTSSPGQSCP